MIFGWRWQKDQSENNLMDKTTPAELLIRHRLAALTRASPGAQRGDVPSIHQARVATRRLGEALPLVAPGARGRTLEPTVRKLRRALGPVRELDVALLTLEELEMAGSVPRPAIIRLRQVVEQKRRLLHTAMRRQLDRINIAKFRRRAITMARKQISAAAGRGRTEASQRLVDATLRAARRASAMRAAIDSVAGIYLPDRLHAVRIALKKMRYAKELAHELSGSRAVAVLRTLKQAQVLLGRMHDLEVLVARTRAVQGSAGAASLRLSTDLDLVVRWLETECRQLHGQYMALRKALLAICDRVEAAAERLADSAMPAA